MTETAETPRSIPWTKLALAAAAVAALLLLGRQAAGQLVVFAQWVEAQGSLGPIFFIAGYALAVVAFVPGALLTLAGGAVFGVVKGSLYVFVAAVIGSTAAFLIARYAAREAFERRLEGNEKFTAIDRAVGREGLKIALLLRLTPAIPFSLLNYALGLTQIRLVDTLIAALGMIPGTVLYVYSGSLVGDVAEAASGAAGAGAGTGRTVLTVVGFVATLVVTVYVTLIARRALQEATEENRGEA